MGKQVTCARCKGRGTVKVSAPFIPTKKSNVPHAEEQVEFRRNDARVFLTAISDEGRDFDLDTQHLLDLFYTTLFAILVATPLARLVPR